MGATLQQHDPAIRTPRTGSGVLAADCNHDGKLDDVPVTSP
jgi:hypothetical protein